MHDQRGVSYDIGVYESAPITNSANVELEEMCISLVPNPVQNEFTIYGNSDDYDILIIDANGQPFQNLSSVSLPHTVDVSALPCGLFFLKVINNTNNQLCVETIIKID